MEVWKEYKKGMIPNGNYIARIVCGDADGLIIELNSTHSKSVLDFGPCDALRLCERKLVDTAMYDNTEKIKENKFTNVIYEVENGKFIEEVKLYSGGFLTEPQAKQYSIIAENICIDVIYRDEQANSFLKSIYTFN